MQLAMTVNMDGEAFDYHGRHSDITYEHCEELEYVFGKVIVAMRSGNTEGQCVDHNGATIGSWEITTDDQDERE